MSKINMLEKTIKKLERNLNESINISRENVEEWYENETGMNPKKGKQRIDLILLYIKNNNIKSLEDLEIIFKKIENVNWKKEKEKMERMGAEKIGQYTISTKYSEIIWIKQK